MMYRSVALVVVIGCYRDSRTTAPYKSDPMPKNCDPPIEQTLTLRGEDQTVALVACTTAENNDAGRRVYQRAAQLVVSGTMRRTVDTWSEGGESGGAVGVIGVLGAGFDDALVVQKSTYSTDVRARTITVYAFDHDWTALKTVEGHDIRATVDGNQLTIETCVEAPQDVSCTTEVLVWDGRRMTLR